MTSLANRQKRVGLHLPLDVDGREAGGARFSETTRTLNVSGGGLAFETARDLQMGSRLDLRIELPPPLRHHFGGKAAYMGKIARDETDLLDSRRKLVSARARSTELEQQRTSLEREREACRALLAAARERSLADVASAQQVAIRVESQRSTLLGPRQRQRRQ